MNIRTAKGDELSEQLFVLAHLSEALEARLMRFSNQGQVGNVAPAGHARWAIIAAAAALEPGDMLFGTVRDLPAALARGVALEAVLHQAFGTGADAGLGRGMPGAVCSAAQGVSLCDGSPAAHLVHAAGWAHAARHSESAQVALALFGSAAQAHPELHAALNFAGVYRSPTVFVARGPLAGEIPFSEAAEAWGLRGVDVPGDDPMAIYGAVADARARALAGEGPTIVDARLVGEPQPKLALALQQANRLTPEFRDTLRADTDAKLKRAIRAAEEAPAPEPDSLFAAVFSDRPWWLVAD